MDCHGYGEFILEHFIAGHIRCADKIPVDKMPVDKTLVKLQGRTKCRLFWGQKYIVLMVK